ncbi:MAG: TIGR02186 family protein [Pseudorhodoplanes sp.]|nr:TIGR02186 family protein [Pseudorhodoplanes sp.]
MIRPHTLLAVIAALAGGAIPASAERLISSLSTHQVLVGSNFAGTELVLFGSIERDAATVPRRGGYDIVVSVTGPHETMVVRRKNRVFGIWTNAQSYTFDRTPSYLAVLSNKPLDAIAPAATLRRLEIGFDSIALAQSASALGLSPPNEFREALLRLRKERGLYREDPAAVTFLTPTLFRASIVIPPESQIGNYEVDVKLFADGVSIARTSSALEIVKVGLEQFIVSAARDHSFLYGIATMMMALMTGWFASIVFRRD